MATRMQQRRGTASQWTSTNAGAGPVLNAGEIGWESDTNRFKIGDGVNNWSNLDYFADINSTVNPSFGTSIVFEGATADSYETTLQVTDPTDDRTITLPNVSGTVITTGNLSDITDIGVFTSTIVMEGSSADDFELTLSAGNPTADRTITFPDATGTVALTTDIAELSQDAVDAALTAGTGITKTYNDNANTLTLAVDTTTIQARVSDVSDTEIGYLNGVTSAIQTQMDAKAPLNSPTFTGTVSLPANTISQSMMSDDSVGTNEIGGLAVTEAKIADGAVTNAKISASAAIAQSKISGLTTDLSNKLALAGGTMTGAIAMGTNKITGLGTPSDSADAATKSYVDAVTEGLHIHEAVVAATTTNVALASALENGDELDGITLATGNRILVKNQSTASENGIYVVQSSGQPTRATDFDTASEVDSGDFVFVYSGTANGSTGWVQTNRPATIGTDAIAFTQFSGAGTYIAGTGLTLTGTVFSINTGTTVDLSTAQTLANKTLTSPIISSVSNTGTLTLPTSTDTLVGRATTDTLTNKSISLTTNTITGTFTEFNAAVTDHDLVSLTSTSTLTNKTLTSPIITGLTLNDSSIVFEGATADAFETTLTVTDPTADRTLTLPDATGTLLSTALFSAKGAILVGTGTGTFTTQSVGTNGQVLAANSAQADGVEWVTPAGGAAFSEFMLIGA